LKYPCAECGREILDYKNLTCKPCWQRTTRTLRILEHRTAAIGASAFKQYLEPGEIIHKAWYDQETCEHVLVIRKHIQ